MTDTTLIITQRRVDTTNANINLASDKQLNILIYWTPSYVNIYRSYILLKIVRIFGPPCIYLQ